MRVVASSQVLVNVRREGEAIDTIISVEIFTQDSSGSVSHIFDVARIWYWVIDLCLDEIDRKISMQFSEYEEMIRDKAERAWILAENDKAIESDEAEGMEQFLDYDETVYLEASGFSEEFLIRVVEDRLNCNEVFR